MTHPKTSIMTAWSQTPVSTMLILMALLFGMLSTSNVLAQSNNLSSQCSAGSVLMDSTTLPFTSNLTNSGSGQLNTSACIVPPPTETDGVKCFIPENSCSISLTGRGSISDTDTRVAITSGTCTDIPPACTGSGASNTIASFAVTGGVQYCFYVESTVAQQIGYSLDSASGDCGSMPVEVIHFSIE